MSDALADLLARRMRSSFYAEKPEPTKRKASGRKAAEPAASPVISREYVAGAPIIHDCIQGTQAWLELRAGIPTASNFDKIITPGGEASKSQEPYMFALLAERMMGHPIVEAMSRWMDRGSQMEAEAVSFYELQHDCETVKVGFITTEDGKIGASLDRLVGDDGLLEIKCPSEAIHVGYMLQAGSAYKAYRVQVQGQLWVSQRQWSDVESYHPEMPFAITRIERDEPFIKAMAAKVRDFSERLEAMSEELVRRGWMAETRERAADWK